MDKLVFELTYQQVNSDFQDYAAMICGIVKGGFLSGPMKSWTSCNDKAKASRIKISDLKDIIRCSFIYTTEEEVTDALELIKSCLSIYQIKDRLNDEGYRDILINVIFEGFVCEIQLHTALGLAAKDGASISHPMVDSYVAKLGLFAGLGHKFYELERESKSLEGRLYYKSLGIAYYSSCRATLAQ